MIQHHAKCKSVFILTRIIGHKEFHEQPSYYHIRLLNYYNNIVHLAIRWTSLFKHYICPRDRNARRPNHFIHRSSLRIDIRAVTCETSCVSLESIDLNADHSTLGSRRRDGRQCDLTWVRPTASWTYFLRTATLTLSHLKISVLILI